MDDNATTNSVSGQNSDNIKKVAEKSRGLLYKEIQSPLNDLVGLCLDQIELVYPHKKGDGSENEQKFQTAKRIILNRFNQFTLPEIQKTLNNFQILEYNDTMEWNIHFKQPTRASGPRLG